VRELGTGREYGEAHARVGRRRGGEGRVAPPHRGREERVCVQCRNNVSGVPPCDLGRGLGWRWRARALLDFRLRCRCTGVVLGHGSDNQQKEVAGGWSCREDVLDVVGEEARRTRPRGSSALGGCSSCWQVGESSWGGGLVATSSTVDRAATMVMGKTARASPLRRCGRSHVGGGGRGVSGEEEAGRASAQVVGIGRVRASARQGSAREGHTARREAGGGGRSRWLALAARGWGGRGRKSGLIPCWIE
jgi:hypothetical protein